MNFIRNLNGLRGIMALWVVYCHVAISNIGSILGHYAVCVFFVLSGFLFGVKNSSGTEKYCLRNIRNSVSKWYYSYLLVLILFAVLNIFMLHKNTSDIALSFIVHVLLVHAWMPSSWFVSLNDPSWFFSAYLGILLIYYLYNRNKLFGIIFLCLSVIISISGVITDSFWWYYMSPYMRFLDFSIAFFMGKCVVKFNNCVSYKNAVVLWLSMVLSIAITLYCCVCVKMGDSIKLSFVFLPSSLIIVYVLYVTERFSDAFFRILKLKFVQYLGFFSMELYLYHFIFARIIFYKFSSISLIITFPMVVVLSICFSFFVKKITKKMPFLKRFV